MAPILRVTVSGARLQAGKMGRGQAIRANGGAFAGRAAQSAVLFIEAGHRTHFEPRVSRSNP